MQNYSIHHSLVTIVRRNLCSWLAVVSRFFSRLQFYPLGSRASGLASQWRSSVFESVRGSPSPRSDAPVPGVRASRAATTYVHRSMRVVEAEMMVIVQRTAASSPSAILYSSIFAATSEQPSPIHFYMMCRGYGTFFCENWTPCPPQVLLLPLPYDLEVVLELNSLQMPQSGFNMAEGSRMIKIKTL